MPKRILAALAVVLVAVGLAVPSVASATANIPGLAIGTVSYNAPGNDVPDNRNKEFIDVVNLGREPVDVKNLRVEDSWAHANPERAGSTGCNHFIVTALPGVVEADGKLQLGPGRTIRVYMGAGDAVLDGRTYKLFKGSNPACGYNGHVLNNNAPASGSGPWDTVWIVKGDASESKSYAFYNGYYVR